MSVQANIKSYLQKNGIKQVFLANASGMETSKLSNILNEHVKFTVDDLNAICGALKVPPSTFIDNEQNE